MSNSTNVFNKVIASLAPKAIDDNSVALTFDGKIAIRRKNGDFVLFNPDTNQIVNNLDFVLNNNKLSQLIFLTPTPVANLQFGDVIKSGRSFHFFRGIGKDGNLKTVNLNIGKASNLTNETNIVTGMKMYDKVTSLMTLQNGDNFNPMLLAFLDKDSDDDNTADLFKTLMMTQMFSGNAGTGVSNPFSNPMMLLAFMGKDNDDDNTDLFKTVMMTQMFSGNAGTFGGNANAGVSNPFSNPMMLLAFMGKDNDNGNTTDLFKTVMMTQMFSGNANAGVSNPFSSFFASAPVTSASAPVVDTIDDDEDFVIDATGSADNEDVTPAI